MKLQYLGTAAAEGFPALYCQCKECQEAWKKGGRNIRTRAQALLDDKILIDFGPDTFFHMLKYNVPLDMIHDVIVTHDHSDHFYETELQFRRKGYASKVDPGTLKIYGTKAICKKVDEIVEIEQMPEYVESVLVTPFEKFNIGDYEILPVRADHDPASDPVNYIIKKDNKIMMYAHDTGYFFKETWDVLEKLGQPLNLLSIDCTAGLLKGWRGGHLSFDVVVEMVEEMKQKHIIDDKTIVIINHFSHNGKATYDTMKEVADKYNIVTSYDGMVVEF